MTSLILTFSIASETKPFLKFSVNAILAKSETDDQDEVSKEAKEIKEKFLLHSQLSQSPPVIATSTTTSQCVATSLGLLPGGCTPFKPMASRPLAVSGHPHAAVAAAAMTSAPLFSSHLQSLLYRHTYLAGGPAPINGSSLSTPTPVTSGVHPLNGQAGPITLPGTGTTVFPLPGSFPWATGSRGESETLSVYPNSLSLTYVTLSR